MKHISKIFFALVLIGAGCAAPVANDSASDTSQTGTKPAEESVVEENKPTKTLEERLGEYLAEREVCTAARLKELVGTPQEGENYGAEYHCTVKVMAPKYYEKDPEGITELCVRLYQISGWNKEGGYYADLTREDLQTRHDLGFQLGVTMDAAGKVSYNQETSQGWRKTCTGLIELNIE